MLPNILCLLLLCRSVIFSSGSCHCYFLPTQKKCRLSHNHWAKLIAFDVWTHSVWKGWSAFWLKFLSAKRDMCLWLPNPSSSTFIRPKVIVFITPLLVPNNQGMKGKTRNPPKQNYWVGYKEVSRKMIMVLHYQPGPAACPFWKLLMPERDCLLVWGFDGKSLLYGYPKMVSQSFQGRCFPLFPWHWVVVVGSHHG